MTRSASLFLALLLLLPAAAASAADFVWANGESAATRWIDAGSAEVGVTKAGQRMEVIFEEGDRVRVRVAGGTFGWLGAADVSLEDPNPSEAGELEGLPEIKLGADGKLQLPKSLQLGGGGEGLKLQLD